MAVAKRLLSPKGRAFGSGAVSGGISSGGGGLAVELFGDKEILAIMEKMRTTSGRRTMSAGAFRAANVLLKAAKKAIPSNNKAARKALGRRRLKVKEAPGGGAKVGGRVGPGSKAKSRGPSSGVKGVGIGAQNIHWAYVGTGAFSGRSERETGKKGGPVRNTGSSRPWTPPMYVLARRNSAFLKAEFGAGARKQLEKEVRKGKAF